jgi:hypothetical protein
MAAREVRGRAGGVKVTGRRSLRAVLCLSLIVLVPLPCAQAHEDMADMPMPGKLGSVSFETSCKPQVRVDFNRGVALLHSFQHDEAERTFAGVAVADSDCAMAYWGEAMTHFHQFLDTPKPSDIIAADQELKAADAAQEKTPREAAYIHALHLFFDGYVGRQYLEHAKLYADSMAATAAAYPRDLEAQVLYALALLASDPPEDVDLVNPRKAVAILYPIFRQYPNHPGVAHYIIHACDNPTMAHEGLEAARRYARIAPASPHALHMPSHIFARLGLWQDDIRSNLASKAAAEDAKGMHVGAENRLHAMEFLEYAYLQVGDDEKARAILAEAGTVSQAAVDRRYAEYYPIVQARYPALFAIETQNWEMAAHLKLIAPEDRDSAGVTLLAHAVAAGHLQDRTLASEAVQAIDALTAKNPSQPGHPGEKVLHDEIHAWADFAKGDTSGAEALLRPIADRQDKIGKGEVELPAREMLAEMFLLRGNARAAEGEYEVSLKHDPNRFNALLGAGRAAQQLGQHAKAVQYYRALVANCPGATGPAVKELEHARAIISRYGSGLGGGPESGESDPDLRSAMSDSGAPTEKRAP